MKLPALVDYRQAVQTPSVSFCDPLLQRCTPRLDPFEMPVVASGGLALTFDVEADRRRYAIRCFHKQGNHRQERYAAISQFVRSARLDCLVDVAFLPDGIRVGGQVFPVIRMPWVSGQRLNTWLDDHSSEPDAVTAVRTRIAAAAAALRRHGAAHGDLQHGNILVHDDRSIQLIDYDGMYLPTLSQYGPPGESGNPNYQHRERRSQYGPDLDVFAAHVIDLSLAAIAEDARLWQDFNSGENLLFSAADLADPGSSQLFRRLQSVDGLAEPLRRLRRACESRFDALPAILAGVTTANDADVCVTQPAMRANPAWDIVRTTDSVGLLARQGDVVTVIGQILKTKVTPVRGGGTVTFLNFGDYRQDAFTVVAWDRVTQDLVQSFGDPATLEGRWVSVTGLLTGYQRRGSRSTTPQIQLSRIRALRPLSAEQAATLLADADADAPTIPATPAAAAAAVTSTGAKPGIGTAGHIHNLDDRLGRLYSSPAFTAALPRQGAAPTQPTPPTATAQAGGSKSVPVRPATKPAVTARAQWPATPVQPKAASAPLPPPRRRASQHVHTTPLPAPRPGYPPAPGPGYRPGLGYPAGVSPYGMGLSPPPRHRTRLGRVALLVSILSGPAGLVIGLVALSRGRQQSAVDRTFAVIAVVVGAVWVLACTCSPLLGHFASPVHPDVSVSHTSTR